MDIEQEHIIPDEHRLDVLSMWIRLNVGGTVGFQYHFNKGTGMHDKYFSKFCTCLC